MGTRGLRVLRHSFLSGDEFVRPRLCRHALRLRYARIAPYVTISDPPGYPGATSISLAHPKDPSTHPQAGTHSSYTFSPPPPSAATAASPPTSDAVPNDQASPQGDASEQQPESAPSVPAKYVRPPMDPHMHLDLTQSPPLRHRPPFNTHKFFNVLDLSFPSPIARNLMNATRGLLIDRIGRVRENALTTQDLDSQAYLFKAALSELRTETSLLTRNETATMRTATTALRREVDTLGTRMKEDIGTLKHEIQMDLDSRQNEAKGDLKRVDMQIEEVLGRALITISELKTQVEESRWEKLKAAVGALGILTLFIMVSMEIYVVQPKAKKPSAPSPPQAEIYPRSGGSQPWVT